MAGQEQKSNSSKQCRGTGTFWHPGLCIVYQLIRRDDDMLVIVTGVREDEEVYEIANKRITKHEL